MTTKASHSSLVALPQDQQLVYCLRSSAVLLYWDIVLSTLRLCSCESKNVKNLKTRELQKFNPAKVKAYTVYVLHSNVS